MSIAPMTKITLLLHQTDLEPVCEALQNVGAIHLTPLDDGAAIADQETGEFVASYHRMERIRQALANLSPAPARLQVDDLSVEEIMDMVEEKLAIIETLTAENERLQDLKERLLPWGDFDPATLALLRQKTRITFAVIANNEWPLIVKDDMTYAIAHENVDYKFAVFFDAPDLPVAPIDLPDARLSDLEEKQFRIKHQIDGIYAHLSRFTQFAGLLESRRKSQLDRVALYNAVHGGYQDAPIVALQGFLPSEKTEEIKYALVPFRVVLQFEAPEPEDEVPVLLRNNAFFNGFEGIVKAFSGVHYREKDVTWMVGILFILFGSLCLLDAGYGLLLMVTGLVLNRGGEGGFGKAFAISGFFATLIGLINGQIFGLIIGREIYQDYQPLFPLAVDPFACFVFSLIVGALAMGFAYGVAIWQRGFKTQATGNLVLVLALGVYMLCAPSSINAIFDQPSPEFLAKAAGFGNLGGGVLALMTLILWVLYPDQVFGREAKAANIFWTLYSGATGLVQDILSHMRLFGIALSGSILALVINQTGGIFPLPITILFAILGHGLVYALALLSMYVHANRLIFLETGSKCIDGGQHYYQPLRRGYGS